jgi:hypothetical protein
MRSKIQDAQVVVNAIRELVDRYGFHVMQDDITVNGESATMTLTIKSNPPALGIGVGDHITTEDKLK